MDLRIPHLIKSFKFRTIVIRFILVIILKLFLKNKTFIMIDIILILKITFA
jgi:hypothetical protein